MASLSFYSQFETNLMSNRKVIELLLELKSAKAHGKNYIKVKPHLVCHLLRNCLLLLLKLKVSKIREYTKFSSNFIEIQEYTEIMEGSIVCKGHKIAWER